VTETIRHRGYTLKRRPGGWTAQHDLHGLETHTTESGDTYVVRWDDVDDLVRTIDLTFEPPGE